MIDPSELRKGNIVEYNGEQVKVVGFDEEYVYLNIATVDYVGFDEVFPIELNKEILLTMGFVYDESKGYLSDETERCVFSLNGFDVSIEENGCLMIYIEIEDHFYSFAYTKIDSLNHLQNLYYINERKELQITK